MQLFLPGQVWTYRARPGEEASRLIVCKVDWDLETGHTVHIALAGVAVQNRYARGGIATTVDHLPFTADALRQSVLEIVATDAKLPPYEDGYRNWRKAYEEGEAGAWSCSVAECLTGMEEAIRNG